MSTLDSARPVRNCLILGAMLLVVACSPANPFDGEWLDAAGRPVPDESEEGEGFVLDTWVVTGHCEWGSATFLLISWPPGRVDADWVTSDIDDGTVRMYVRDPEGLFAGGGLFPGSLVGEFDADADVPASAETSGLHRGDWEIWTSADDDALYLVGPERAERWQRARTYIGCA